MSTRSIPTDPPAPSAGEAWLIFDGDCGFCTRSVLWLKQRWSRPVRSLPWQHADLPALGLSEAQTRRQVWWVEARRESFESETTTLRREGGHRAVARALQACKPPWPAVGTLLLLPPPFAWIFAAGYRLVARLRGHLPGTTPACRRPEWPP